MKHLLNVGLAGCAVLIMATNGATGQTLRIDVQTLPGMASSTSADCALAKDPQRCAARNKARDDCKGLRGGKRRQCLAEHPSPIDCSKSDKPRHCQAQQAAIEACRNKAGAQHRECLRHLLK